MKKTLLILLLLTSCATQQPTPFETGEETWEPYGCTELKFRDPNADC